MRDVIIVGGGPAGTSTAKELAEEGLDVAVYEKRQEIGAPKRCGEGLSSNSMKTLDLDVPDYCKMQPMKGAKVHAPNGDSADVNFDRTAGWILERKQFDKWMAKRAARAGADVYANTKVTGLLENNKGIKGIRNGEEFKEESKVVVAADGVESLVAIEAGIKNPSQLELVDSGFQYEMTNIDMDHPEKIVLYLGNNIAPRGYVWIFPKGDDTANVGIGILGNHDKTAKHYLDKFLEDRPELNKGSIVEVNSGGIPVGGFLDDMTEENCLAVGDAANQVNPIHGGGMAESIKASKIASDVISNAIEEGDTSKEALQEYNERWWKERGQDLRDVEKVREVMENLSDEDLNFLAKELEGDDLTSLSHGNALKKLGKVLLKRPSLVKLGRKLI